MSLKKAIILLLCLYASIHATSSWGQSYKFTNYDFRHGLPITQINCIAQDSFGFIWLGSANGLVRFDGYEFKHFVVDDQDSTALSGNDISTIKVAPNGEVWIGTHDNGISIWDYSLNGFKRHTYQINDPVEILNGAIYDFHFGGHGETWVGGARNGLYKVDQTGEWEKVNTGEIHFTVVSSFQSDPSDSASFYIGSQYLYHFNSQNNKFEKINTNHQGWSTLLTDQKGRIWGKQYHEKVTIFDPKTELSIQLEIGKLKRASGFTLSGDRAWVGSIDGGIYTIDIENLDISEITLQAFDPWSLPTDIVQSVFTDKSGLIWFGTGAGVSLMDPDDQHFKNVYLRAPGQSTYIEPHSVYPITNGTKHLVAPYYYKEILLYDLKSEKFDLIPKTNKSEYLHAPFKIWEHDQRYLIHYSNGIAYFDENTMHIQAVDIESPDGLFGKRIIVDTDMDENDQIWSVDVGNIVYVINQESGVLDTFQIKQYSKEHIPRSILCNSTGAWLGLTNGVVRIDLESRKKTFFIPPQYPELRTGINDVFIDLNNHIWVATYREVLYKYKCQDDSLMLIRSYDLKDGLAGKTSGEISGDGTENIFISSASGFSVYDQATDRFVHFNTSNGLLSNRLNGISTIDGLVYCTTHAGYAYAETGLLSKSDQAPEILFSNVQIGDSSWDITKMNTHHSLTFSYNQNDLSVEYLGIHFPNPRSVQYRYRLLPDSSWIQANADSRNARYPNLESGKYSFEIQSSINGFLWGEKQSFPFKINKPFWERWWFRGLLLILIGSLMYLFIKWRERQVKSSEQTRAQMAELELKALRSQMNPHFMFNSLNSIKNFILKSKPADAAQYLSSFAHLIRLTLQNSREKTISLSQEIETLMLYIDLEKLRFKKGFEFTCEVDERLALDDIQIPPLLLQPYVENAIWHGLMHKQDDAILSLSFQKSNGSIECTIEDNGVGREQAARLKSSSARNYKSMGMGITKDRIDIHNQISALGIKVNVIDKKTESGDPAGTKVMIKIPDVIRQ